MPVPSPPPRAPDDALVQMRRARDLADRAYAEQLDLDRLAAAAGLSQLHFLRLFRVTYGLTPAQYRVAAPATGSCSSSTRDTP